MPVAVEQVDPADDAAVAELHRLQVATADHEYATPMTRPELSAFVRRPQPYYSLAWYVGRDVSGTAVGWAHVELTLKENTDIAWVDGGVLPAHRRRGHGKGMLEHVLGVARQRGRTSTMAAASWPMTDSSSPARRLLERAGLTLREVETHRVLDLPVPPDRLDALAVRAAPHHAGYRLVGWSGPSPDHWVDEYAVLLALIGDQAPKGDLEFEADRVDAARVRDVEAEWLAQQRIAFTQVAIAAGGRLAGHSQLVVPQTDQENAYQWDTLVLPEHRGHRLGLALKVANHQAAADALVPRTLIHTWNSDSNDPMVAVNAALGYRAVRQQAIFQGSI